MGARDTVPLAGRVVLHAISASSQGPIDSTLAAADGRYRFRFRYDARAVYIVSARHAGIEYFSRPLIVMSGNVDTTSLLVHDTSSTAPVGAQGHYWVIGRPSDAKRRPVLDLVLLRNEGPLTRVARDSQAASWSMPLPAGAKDVSAGQGEFSPSAIEQRGDSLRLLAPLQPGNRQLVLQYTVPLAGKVTLPVGQSADSLFVLLEEADAAVTTDGFAVADTQRIDNRVYRRWVGSVAAPGAIEVRFASAAATNALAPLVAVLALVLGVVTVYALGRRKPAPVPAADRVSRLVEEIASLDATYAGREGEVDAESWQRYQADRARLRRELDAALAARGAGG